MWQQEQRIAERGRGEAKRAEEAVARDETERDTAQETAYRREIAYEKEQTDTLAFEARNKAANEACGLKG